MDILAQVTPPIVDGSATFPQWFLWALAATATFLAGGVGVAIRWCAANVVIPMRDRHFRFMDDNSVTNAKLTALAESINSKVDSSKVMLTKVSESNEAIARRMERLACMDIDSGKQVPHVA